jgi:hypothetical protein
MTSTVFSRPVALRVRVMRIAFCAVMGMALALCLSACGHAAGDSTSVSSQQQATTENQSQEQGQGQDAAGGTGGSSSEEKALQDLDISKVGMVKEQTDEAAHKHSYTLAFDVTNNGTEKVSFAPYVTADLDAKDAYGDSVKADSRIGLSMTQTNDDLQASDVVLTGGNGSIAAYGSSTIGFISYLEPGATKHCQATVTPETSLDSNVTFGGKTIKPTEVTASNFEIRIRFSEEAEGTGLIYNPYDKTITKGTYGELCKFYPTEQDAIKDELPFAVKANGKDVNVSFNTQHNDDVNGDNLMMTVTNNTDHYLEAVKCTVKYNGPSTGVGSGIPDYIIKNLRPGETQTQSVSLISLEAGDQIPTPVYSEYVVDPDK